MYYIDNRLILSREPNPRTSPFSKEKLCRNIEIASKAVMPDVIRHPDVVPAKAGNQSIYCWIPP